MVQPVGEKDEACAHLAQLAGRRVPRGLFIFDGALFDLSQLDAQLDHRLFEFRGFFPHARDFCRPSSAHDRAAYAHPLILFCNAGLMRGVFLLAVGLGDVMLMLRYLRVLA
jgi:hypothetical protein